MNDTPDLGPVPERICVEAAQVRQLIKDQLPQWADMTIEPVADGGWDNWTFHLGDELVVRLPSATEYAKAVEKEHKWLPVLAPRLPMPIPTPVAEGVPSPAYPHPWSVYRWIDGHTASAERIADHRAFAIDLVAQLCGLRPTMPLQVRSRGSPGLMEALNSWRMRAMAAPRKYPDELRERATPMAVDARQDPTTWSGAIPRIVTLGREVGELRRANEILKTSAAFFAAEHWDGSPLGEVKS